MGLSDRKPLVHWFFLLMFAVDSWIFTDDVDSENLKPIRIALFNYFFYTLLLLWKFEINNKVIGFVKRNVTIQWREQDLLSSSSDYKNILNLILKKHFPAFEI